MLNFLDSVAMHTTASTWKGVCAILTAVSLCHGVVFADVQVNERKDQIILVDGKKVECIVVMITKRGVLAIVKDKEAEEGAKQVLFPRHQVKQVIRGKDRGQAKGFQTDPERARKVVKGEGFRKEKEKKKAGGPLIPSGPIQKAEPLITRTSGTTAPSSQLPFNSKLSAADLAKAYTARFPGLKKTAEMYLGGSTKLQSLFQKALKGDPVVREQLESFLTKMLENDAAPPSAATTPRGKQPSPHRRTPPPPTKPTP